MDLMERSRVNDLRDDAAELSSLIATIRQPFPELPNNPDNPKNTAEREMAMLVITLRARDHARRLLALMERGRRSY
jgi:hypothetical protein